MTNARRALARGCPSAPAGSGRCSRSCRPPSSGASGCWSRPTLGWPVGCRMGEPAGQPARPGRPADPQGAAGPTGRVRRQGAGPGQPRRDRARPPGHGGNPPDAPLLGPAVKRVIARTGRAPGAVTGDRGYGEAAVDQELTDLGVARVASPRRGRAGPTRQLVERQRGVRRLVKWRTGCGGRSAGSSTASVGTAPAWTASTAPGSGAATACSPTTWSTSVGCWRPGTARRHEHPEHSSSHPTTQAGG